MSLAYIRAHYGVPAAHFVRVVADGKPGTIVGHSDASLLVLLDHEKHPAPWHPTWEMSYEPAPPINTQLLIDVENGQVHVFTQRGVRYVRNERAGTRMTHQYRKLTDRGLVAETGRVHGPITYLALTDEGTATLAAHRRLIIDGPVITGGPADRSTGQSRDDGSTAQTGRTPQ